jgi:hypothetical protein
MANNAPTATGHNQTVAPGTGIALSTLFTFFDPDAGDSVTGFAVQDKSAGGGHLFLNGVQQADNFVFGNTATGIPINQLSQWTFVAGPAGSVDSIGFSPIDSHQAFSNATATVTAQSNHDPNTPVGHDQTIAPGSSVALSTLFTNFTDPDAGDTITAFYVRDRTVGGGHLLKNGVVQTDDALFGPIAIGELSQWSFRASSTGGQSDTVGFQTVDNHNATSLSATASVTAQSNHDPNTPVGHDQTIAPGSSVALSTLFTNFTDPDAGDTITAFYVRDRTVGGGHLLKNGVVQTDDALFGPIAIGELSQWLFQASGTGGQSDTVGFQTVDNHNATSLSATAAVTAQSNHDPNTPVGHDQTIAPGSSVALSTLFTNFTDPDAGDTITAFYVRDRTVGGGHLLKNGVVQTDDALFGPIAIGELSQWSFRASSTGGQSDTVGFQTVDNHNATSLSATASVTAQSNHDPNTPVGHDQTIAPGSSVALSTLFTNFTDPDAGDTITTFYVRDRTVGGGHLLKNGVVQTDDALFGPIAIGELSQWSFRASSTGGQSDTVGFQTVDNHNATSLSATAAVTALQSDNAPNTPVGHDQTIGPGVSIALSTLFTNFTDPDAGDSVTQFYVRDRTVGGGHLTLNGIAQQENQIFGPIPIGQLNQWAFVAGSTGGQLDTIGFQTVDSHGVASISATANVTAQQSGNHAPLATGHDRLSATPGAVVSLSSLFTYSDPDIGDSVAAFAVRDRSIGGGHLTLDGVAQTENATFDNVPISQIGHWAFVAGPAGSSDVIGFQAIDSHGAYTSPSATASVTTSSTPVPTNHAPVVTGPTTLDANVNDTFALGSKIQVNDPDGNQDINHITFYDSTPGAGKITFGGTQITANQITVSPSELGQIGYATGSIGNSWNKIAIVAYDNSGAPSNELDLTIKISGGTPSQYDPDHFPVVPATVQTESLGGTKIVDIARLFANAGQDWGALIDSHGVAPGGVPWHVLNCTGLVWAITYLAGAPFYDLRDHTKFTSDPDHVNDPPSGSPRGYVVPSASNISAHNEADGWHLVTRSLTDWKSTLQLGDVVRLYGQAGEKDPHSFVVSQTVGGIKVIDNFFPPSDNTNVFDPNPEDPTDAKLVPVSEHLLSELQADFQNPNEVFVFRLDPARQTKFLTVRSDGDENHSYSGAAGSNLFVDNGSNNQPNHFNINVSGSTVLVSRDDIDPVPFSISGYQELQLNGGALADTATIPGLAGTDIANSTVFFNGMNGDDFLDGSASDKSIVADGGSGNDILSGGSSADTFTGGSGNDSINGGPGIDTAIFSGLRSASTITHAGNSLQVSGPDGFDTLTSVERLTFDDMTIPFESIPRDFNADGTSDVFWRNDSTGHVGTWEMHNNVQTWHDLGGSGVDHKVAGIGDFNGDGTADVLWRNDTSGHVGIWEMHNNVQTWHDLGGSGVDHKVAGIGDFNGDGTADVLWRNDTSGHVGIWEMHDNVQTWHDLGGSGVDHKVAGIGDFNGDGTADVLWRNDANGHVGIWEMHDNIQTWHDLGGSGVDHKVVGIGDLNGDGTADVLWRNDSNGHVGIWEIHNDVPSWRDLGFSGADHKVAGTGDYNGDGTSDIFWRNDATGHTGFWEMHNNVPTWHDLGGSGVDHSFIV